MEELIELITTQARITEDQAKIVIEVLGSFLSSEVSEPCLREIETRFGTMSMTETQAGTETRFGVFKVVAEKAEITMEQAEVAVNAAVEHLTAGVSDECGMQIEGLVRGGG